MAGPSANKAELTSCELVFKYKFSPEILVFFFFYTSNQTNDNILTMGVVASMASQMVIHIKYVQEISSTIYLDTTSLAMMKIIVIQLSLS